MYRIPVWIIAIAIAIAAVRYAIKPCCEVAESGPQDVPPDTVLLIPGDTVMLIPGDSIRIRGPHGGTIPLHPLGLLLKKQP